MSDPSEFENELRAALGDRYALERELTGSGMSRVFVATERALDRQVVVKVLPPELAAGVNRERFRREIQLAAQLQHPHIVPLHAAGTHGDLLYFTMPFIEGESLRHAVHEGVRFTPRDVIRILHDVADALAYAHARGVIHRDIKPGNVLRSGSHAMVTDFGVAKAISAALPAAGMTTSGMAIGTPQYMAPEQLAGDPAADHRVDIYALGLLGYELLAGEAPFKAPSPQETMAAQLTRVPEPISRKRPDVPPALAALLAHCLAKNPADRPQTAAEIATALDEMDVSSGSTMRYRVRTPAHRWLTAAAVVLAVTASALAWRLWGPSKAPPTVASAGAPADTTVVIPVAPVLTREDSFAIARAIERKVQEQRTAARATSDSISAPAVTPTVPATPGTPVATPDASQQMARLADSLRQEIQRAVLDSVARVRGMPNVAALVRDAAAFESLGRRAGLREGLPPPTAGRGAPVRVFTERRSELAREAFAERAANLGPPRRVFVSYPTLPVRAESFVPVVDSMVDSLRHTLARDPRFVVIDADSVRAALLVSRAINTIARRMNVELIASLYVAMLPDGSVNWTMTARDISANGAYTTRATSHRSLPGTPMAAADSLVPVTLRLLHEMDLAPRRRAAPDSSTTR